MRTMKDDKIIYIIIVIFALLVLAGFYLVFDKISGLRVALENAKMNYQLASQSANNANPSSPSAPEALSSPTSSTNNQNTLTDQPAANGIAIPTGIIFTASSSPMLQPQASITVTIDSITQKSDGTILFSVKAFTDQSSSYSAIDLGDLMQLVNLNGDNRKANDIKGAFNSMPPGSAVTGSLSFQGSPNQNSIILQIGQDNNLKFYEINFLKGTYKETVIG